MTGGICSVLLPIMRTPEGEYKVDPSWDVNLLRQRLIELAAPIPSTKGMGPKDRADRLHAELLRRIKVAREAVHCVG